MALPTCECFKGLTPNEKADAIYCALYSAISVPDDLPTCLCVKGLPLMDKVTAIYCALLQFVQQAGGPVNINDVLGMTPAGLGLITTLPTPGVQIGTASVVLIDQLNSASTVSGLTSSGVVSPVSNAQSVNGVLIALT